LSGHVGLQKEKGKKSKTGFRAFGKKSRVHLDSRQVEGKRKKEGTMVAKTSKKAWSSRVSQKSPVKGGPSPARKKRIFSFSKKSLRPSFEKEKREESSPPL